MHDYDGWMSLGGDYENGGQGYSYSARMTGREEGQRPQRPSYLPRPTATRTKFRYMVARWL